MKYNFDKLIDRTGTNSLKYDFSCEHMGRDDLLSLWVADMDFELPQEILAKIKDAVDLGIFGYSEAQAPYYEAVQSWFLSNFNWNIERKWIVKTPGIVFAIATAIRAFSSEGDSILIQQPVYYPFANLIKKNKRKIVNNELLYEDGKYTIDYKDFEEKIVKHKVSIFILCSPHNPVGRVWTKSELLHLGEICLKHNVLIISDEIHCDFVYPGFEHTIFSTIDPRFADFSIICTAPSKTFNIAGLQVSNIIISNERLRKKFDFEISASGYSQINSIGMIACTAAYSYGKPWLDELKLYLKENLDYSRDYIIKNIPDITLIEPEGTYLLWLDFSKLKLSDDELQDLIIDKAKLWLDPGKIFGKNSVQFQRINIACPRSILKKALEQLKEAIVSM